MIASSSKLIGVRAAALVGLVVAGTAHAQFTAVDTFQDPAYTVGSSINGINGWTVSQGSGVIALDPAGGANQVLSAFQTSGTAVHIYHGLSLPDASVGTLFFRIRTANPVDTTAATDISVGMSDVAAPLTGTAAGGFGAYEPQLAYVNVAAGAVIPGEVRARDGGVVDVVDGFGGDTWYNVWMVIDNPNDLFQVYMQGGALAVPTLLDAPDGETWFTFRNTVDGGMNTSTSPVANAMESIYLRAGGSHRGPAYFDDFYFDGSGANIVNPIPEPGSGALIGLGLLGLLLRKRFCS